MKLKRVEMLGFKSFVDKTVIELDEGITAILGPNGCGKSNIVDAIRWVLGEQSAKQLRGEKMDDIIFKGTAKRKAVGLCEVSLVFSNEDRALNIEFDEVLVKRRVTREGVGQYFLNNAPVRLKDLKDLFFDSGINNTAYSVIEQEKISRVLQDNSQEVRLLIEEGAGIVKYKARRKEAQRKLDQTEQDLLRLRDIIEEIGREVRSLQRQVGKARRYRKLYQQNRVLDLMLARRSVIDMEERVKNLSDTHQEMTVLLEADSGELADLRAKIEATRPAVDEREAERSGLEDSLRSFESDLHQSEQRVLLLEHRIKDLKTRLDENCRELESVKERRKLSQEENESLKTRQDEVADSVDKMKRQVQQMQEDLDLVESSFARDRKALEQASQLNMEFIEKDGLSKGELREIEVRIENRYEQIRSLDKEKQSLVEKSGLCSEDLLVKEKNQQELLEQRRELLSELTDLEKEQESQRDQIEQLNRNDATLSAQEESLKNQYELLNKIKNSYHGFGGGAKAVLQKHKETTGVLGSLADTINVEEKWNVAIETTLSGLLDSVVVDSQNIAVKLIDELKENNSGIANFMVTTESETGLSVNAPAGSVLAASVVSGPGINTGYIKWLLDRTFLFADDSVAFSAAAAFRSETHCFFVSQSGLMISNDGIIRGGQGKSEEVSILGRGDKLNEIKSKTEAISDKHISNKSKLDECKTESAATVEKLNIGKEKLSNLDKDISSLHVDIAEQKSKNESASIRIDSIDSEKQECQTVLKQLDSKKNDILGSMSSADKQRDDSGLLLDDLRDKVKAGEAKRDKLRSETSELKLVFSTKQSELRELEVAIQHRRETVASLDSAEARLIQENEQDAKEIGLMEAEIVEKRQVVTDGIDERERRRMLVRSATESISSIHEETASWHDRVKEIEEKRTNCREKLHEAETELATIDVRKSNIVERIEDQYKGQFRELVRSIDMDNVPKELEMDGEMFQVDQATTILENGRRKINTLGAVNHLAVEEYEQKKERLTFLEEQLADVEKAKKDLSTTILQINRTASSLFQDTFEEVRKNYIAVFQTLFNGGRADLIQVRTEDPLESQIQVLAQPKGKRVDQIRLLSGGERCMTALSLLFAVYLVKPSPFCLLDEADAPLDDENINRFVKMLEEFADSTQFLVVTHNKLTMESANHLYGVTMMEKGVSNLVSVTFKDVADVTTDDQALGVAIASRRKKIDQQPPTISSEEVDELIASEGTSGITMEAGE